MNYTDNILADTRMDLAEDIELQIYLVKKKMDQLQKFSYRIDTNSDVIPISLSKTLHSNIDMLLQEFAGILQNSTQIHAAEDAYQVFEKIRTLYAITAGIITSTEWQSPSFDSSHVKQIGTEVGIIQQSINDYKRDQHFHGKAYEQAFKKEYIDALIKFPISVYATNSGMAALTTIIGFLFAEVPNHEHIFMGKSSYFEEKKLINNFFPTRITEFDEHDLNELIEKFKRLSPSIIFLDSLGNSHIMSFPNLPLIIEQIKKLLTKDTYLVIDNTCQSIFFQPFRNQLFSHPKLHLICWESLLKHHQFGMDRTNGGIIYASGKHVSDLYTFRDHLGTNISDTASVCLPYPNRLLLKQRLLRHQRNKKILYERIPTDRIISPDTSEHSANQWAKNSEFTGAFITLRFPEHHQNLSSYNNFMKNVLLAAAKKNLSIIGGTSFGLPLTRIYIPASRQGQGTPFVRISVGTEPRSVFENIAETIAGCI